MLQRQRASFTGDGFFRTGDLAHIDPDGQAKIIGRVKEQFKTSKGEYVAPAPIESKLMADPLIESCCVMGSGMASPVALVVLAPDARKQGRSIEDSLRKLMDRVNETLDAHERLCRIVVANDSWSIANGMLTPTLKVRRAVLEKRYLPLVESSRERGEVVWE